MISEHLVTDICPSWNVGLMTEEAFGNGGFFRKIRHPFYDLLIRNDAREDESQNSQTLRSIEYKITETNHKVIDRGGSSIGQGPRYISVTKTITAEKQRDGELKGVRCEIPLKQEGNSFTPKKERPASIAFSYLCEREQDGKQVQFVYINGRLIEIKVDLYSKSINGASFDLLYSDDGTNFDLYPQGEDYSCNTWQIYPGSSFSKDYEEIDQELEVMATGEIFHYGDSNLRVITEDSGVNLTVWGSSIEGVEIRVPQELDDKALQRILEADNNGWEDAFAMIEYNQWPY